MMTRRDSILMRMLAAFLVTVLAGSVHPALAQLPEEDLARPAERAAAARPAIPLAERDHVLGKDWRKSTDRGWATVGDADGFHFLLADAATGYAWRTVATLSEPGIDTDSWIGNACVSGSGAQAVIVYAPRRFTNRGPLFDRGGFTAVLDLATGKVSKLPVRTSLAYFNPSCGAGTDALLTQAGDEDLGRTRLIRLDTDRATLGAPIEVPGQLTSAVPGRDGIIAADSGAVVRVDDQGRRRFLAPAAGVPFKIAPDADGGAVFMDRAGEGRVAVRRVDSGGAVSTLITSGLTELDVGSGRGGRVFVTGAHKSTAVTPHVSLVKVPTGARLSTDGRLAVTSARSGSDGPVISANVPATGENVEFRLDADTTPSTDPAAGRAPSPLPGHVRAQTAGDPHDPADLATRTCSVPRSSPRDQAMQPRPRQVEWAVDQAVRNALTIERPANWKNLGMPTYTPQGLFPPIPLEGGGYVPAQVMLGITAQESNMWQAGRYAVPGVTANPLIGNYYGINYYNGDPADDWTIDWSKADCGYGITQLTDGMRLAGKEKPGETALPYQQQRAVALDFAANVAAGVRILQDKWNQVSRAGLKINNGDPAKLENWFYAIWAYNSGFYADKKDGSPWGLGWLNNPVNPRYPANRKPFLEFGYDDARHPQHWPYPEKVLGWAGHPVEILDAPGTLVSGFRPAWWPGGDVNGPLNRQAVKPPVNQFCNDGNQCYPDRPKVTPTAPEVIGEPAGPCYHTNAAGQYDLKCWTHQSSTWKPTCNATCGNELLRFDAGFAYQPDGSAYPPQCTTSGLPGNALIIDDVPDGTPAARPDCTRPWTDQGSFRFTYGQQSDGTYPGKVDTHQIGGGFGGHFWFAHSWAPNSLAGRLKVTGTWTLNRALAGWARVLVHLPDHGAHTQRAVYTVRDNDTVVAQRSLLQRTQANGWVALGAFDFTGRPSVSLANHTDPADGSENIAWDAIAFQPLPGKPSHQIVVLGDSYASGEGATVIDGKGTDYYRETDYKQIDAQGRMRYQNACHRSRQSWSRKNNLGGYSIGAQADTFDPNMDFHFLACSGARTENLLPSPPPGQEPVRNAFGNAATSSFGEGSQLDRGFLDHRTTMVALSIGGNDADFASTIQSCILDPDCRNQRTSNGQTRDAYTRDNITYRVAPSVDTVIREIRHLAPHAKIILMGYPVLLSKPCGGLMSQANVDWLKEMAFFLKDKLTAVVANPPPFTDVRFGDPIPAFTGHGACGELPAIHGAITSDFATPGETPGQLASQQSFHPNPRGTSIYAEVFGETIHRQ